MTYPSREDLAKPKDKKKKRMAQSTAKNLSDALFSKIVRNIGYCERCGRTGRLECSHWIGRTASNTRTDFDNAFSMCHACHRWWHADATRASAWAIGMRGQEIYDQLREAANQPSKVDWVDELARLREIAKREGVAA